MKLSHSKVQKYKQCPRMYDLHYNKKIRSIELGSPLWFGSALDDAIGTLLLSKKKKLTKEEQEMVQKGELQVFDEGMRTNMLHREQEVDIMKYEHTVYSKADFDLAILTDEDFEQIGEDKAFVKAHMEWYYVENKKKSPEITDEDRDLFNKINWISLYRKGLMIIDAYEKEIMPEIHEVFAVQKTISLPNEDGDEIIGFIDFICSFVYDPDTKVIVDNKSSSKAYKQQDLDESDQLHTYAEAEGIEDICYIVYEKNIRKREPKVRITIWRGKINEDQMEKTFDNYIEVLDNIKEGKFEPDFNSGCFFFGKPCIYHEICHKEKMSDKLVNLNKEKK